MSDVTPQFEVVDVPTAEVLAIRRIVPMAGLTTFFGEAFESVAAAVGAGDGTIIGPPFGWYHSMPTHTIDLSAGFPVAGVATDPGGDMVLRQRPGGLAVVAIHVGSYDSMVATYGELETWMRAHELRARSDMWEEYLNEPTGDPATWQTRIVAPIVSG